MSKQELKVSTFFMAWPSGLMLGVGLARVFIHAKFDLSVLAYTLGGLLLLLVSIFHVGLEDF